MWYKNKRTGLIWHVSDKELQKKLEQDNNYENVKASTKQAEQGKFKEK